MPHSEQDGASSIAARGREASVSGAFITATEAEVLAAGVATAAGPASSPVPSSPSR